MSPGLAKFGNRRPRWSRSPTYESGVAALRSPSACQITRSRSPLGERKHRRPPARCDEGCRYTLTAGTYRRAAHPAATSQAGRRGSGLCLVQRPARLLPPDSAPHSSLDETRTYLDRCCRHWAAGSSYTYLITEASDPALAVGAIDLRDLASGVLFSFVLARASWGCGYALEALKIAIIAAFAHPHVTRIWSFAHPDNAASCRVMEKAGVHLERIVPRFMVFPNLSAELCDVRL